MRKIIVCLWLLFLLAGIGGIFWHYQLRYSLPTPVPAGYRPVTSGAVIDLMPALHFNDSKPVLLHFFNASCPCSRFNMRHVKSLIAAYGKQVHFAVILMDEKYATARQVQEKYDLQVPVMVNPALAFKCGVYSTPQAAVLTARHRLYYRGNYNSNRYCTDPETEYARLALVGLLQQKPAVHFNTYATTAYGCSLTTSYN
ncbi:DUF6436 domain-containing protein [Mucilaginibacter sp.]